MRKMGEFAWIICLLLMEYGLSEDTCERSTCLGQLSFGNILPLSAFITRYRLSLYQCATECRLRRQRCKSFNYRRSFLSCQLCEQDSGPEGINLQPEAGAVHSNIDTWKIIRIGNCNAINCSWTQRCDSSKHNDKSACVSTECPFAVLKPWVSIEPLNETSVGTKARYRCVSQNMERGDPITTCLESRAEWSTTDFKCVCKTPPAIPGVINETSEVEVGQNYTYRCQCGLFEKGDQNPTVTCQHDGSWTSKNFICVKQNWTKDTIHLNNTHKSDVISNETGIDLLTCMQQCDDKLNNCLSFFYDNHTNHCVLSSSFRRGLPDGFQSSDGLVYYIVQQNWMKDTIHLNNIHKSDVISNETGIDLLTCMQQCDDKLNNCLSFFYDKYSSHCVLSSSFQRGLPDGFQFSDGLVYYTAPSATCDMKYYNVILGGSYFCIKFHDVSKTFNEAMKICETEKAKLLVITTQAEINDLNPFIGHASWIFLGMSDPTNEGQWVSWDGKAVSPYWNPGEPNNMYNETCASIRYSRHGVHGFDCNRTFPFLCHKKHLCSYHSMV